MAGKKKRTLSREHKLETVPVNRLRENDWNPNEMDEDDFEQLVAEVRRLGRVAKPIVVRPSGGQFEIIDGAHNFRAARDVGLKEVLCEIDEDMSDIEARIQTYMRNQHGQHDPLLEGLMFEKMLNSEGEFSNRGLAKRLTISEGKIRQSLKYVEAFRMRLRYAESASGEPLSDEDGREQRERISGLTQRELEDYFNLPDVIRDRWLDALKPKFVSQRLRHQDPVVKGEFCVMLERLATSGIAAATPDDSLLFGESFDWMIEVDQWLQGRISVEGLVPFAVACAPWLLPIRVFDLLPCRYGETGGEVVLPAETWTEFVTNACQRYEDEHDRYAMISARVGEWLRENEIDPTEVSGFETAELMNELSDAPDVLQTATFLSLDERIELWREIGKGADEQTGEVLERVLASAQARRMGEWEDGNDPLTATGSVVDIFRRTLSELRHQTRLATERELLHDVESVRQELRNWLVDSEALAEVRIEGKFAVDMLLERLDAMEAPELILIRAGRESRTAVPVEQHWLDAVIAAEAE